MPTDVTVTIKSSGGDYSSMLDLVTSYPTKDLVAADVRLLVECHNFADTTAVFLAGWTTDVDHPLHFYAVDAHQSTGRMTTNAYRLDYNANAAALTLGSMGTNGVVIFEGMQVSNENTGASADTIRTTTGSNSVTFIFVKCVIDANAGPYPLVLNNATPGSPTTIDFVNCYIMGGARGIWGESNGPHTINVTHCTIAECSQYGIAINQANITVNVNNSYVQGVTSSIQVWAGTVNLTKVATSDADGDIPNVTYDATNFTDVTLYAEDLRLTATSDCLDVGNDLSAESWPLNATDDIDSGTRTAATPDVGADEYNTTGTYSPPYGVSVPVPPPEYISPDNTFRDDFPYLKPRGGDSYYANGPPPPDVMDWMGGASW